MRIEFDPAKDETNRRKHGISLQAADGFDWDTALEREDDRFDYGEARFITAGHLGGRLVVMVWTQRGEARHIISMRHCHANEEEIWLRRMG